MPADVQSPLSFAEHRELSRELKETHSRISELRNLVTAVYGADHQTSLAFSAAADVLARLRNEMQRQAAEDCPGTRAGELYR